MKESLVKNFLRISSIPRKSGDEKRISDFFVNIAKENNLEYFQDESNNVLIRKKGNINKPSILFQAHLDMVCVKKDDSNHDFNVDGINVIIDGDEVKAKDTSLGADQGVGLAIMLTLIENKDISHPDLEFLFTTEEETTFNGVVNFDYSKIISKNIINLDNSSDETVMIGSYGDILNEYTYESSLIDNNMPSYKITLGGFKKGNAGENVLESKTNPINIVSSIINNKEIYLKSINGGTFENDLVSECEMVINTDLDISNLFLGYNVTIENVNNNKTFSLEDTKIILDEILSLNSGVLSDTSSANLGTINTINNAIKIKYLIRSIDIDELNNISNKTKICNNHFNVKMIYDDPIWKPNYKSVLLKTYKDVYYSIYNKYPKEVLCQGGTECGSIIKRINDIDIISIGANMENIHSVDEITYISSWEKIYNIILELLKNI